jgi:hypothetical protein
MAGVPDGCPAEAAEADRASDIDAIWPDPERRLFNRLKPFRRVAARYDKLDEAVLPFIHLTAALVMIRGFVNTLTNPSRNPVPSTSKGITAFAVIPLVFKPFCQSGRRDLNPRPLDPQSSALAKLRYAPVPEGISGDWVIVEFPGALSMELPGRSDRCISRIA